MARLQVHSSLDRAWQTPTAVLVVDPDGTPAERALSRYDLFGHEGDRVFYLLHSDGWAEHSYEGDRLTVDVAVHPSGLKRLGEDGDPLED